MVQPSVQVRGYAHRVRVTTSQGTAQIKWHSTKIRVGQRNVPVISTKGLIITRHSGDSAVTVSVVAAAFGPYHHSYHKRLSIKVRSPSVSTKSVRRRRDSDWLVLVRPKI